MEEGKLNYKVILDNSALQAQAEESRDILRGIGRTATQEGEQMEGAMKKMGAAMAGAFAVGQLKDFALKVATVRGEFQQLEIAFSTMLGNKQQADALMQQLIDTAATTPFGMNDIANSAKQLLAYGAEADKVNETLVRLGDIAAGLSIPINDLAYLYGTTMVQGRLYTQDLNQFLNRGIPLVDELAKQFGVTKGEVKQLVEQGKVGFPEVEKAIVAMTSEGSKFGGLMEAQSKSITGQISNLEDAVEQMINEVGKSSEGVIGGMIGFASSAVENWRSIGETILVVASAVGTYKAAVIGAAAVQRAIKSVSHTEEAAQLYALMNAEQKARISKLGLVKTSEEYYLAVKAEMEAEMERQTQLAQTTQAELAGARERLAVAEAQKAAAVENVAAKRAELEASLQAAVGEQEAAAQKRIAMESEAQSRAALRVAKLQEQRDAALAQARALKEAGASEEVRAAKTREIAAINAKLAAAKNEEVQRARNIVAIRAETRATSGSTASKQVEKATQALATAEEELNTAAKARNTAAMGVNSTAAKLDSTLRRANTLETGVNTAAQTANTGVTNLLTAAKTRLTAAAARLNAVIMANPWAIALAGVVALGYGLYKLVTHQSDAQKQQEALNESFKVANSEADAETKKIESLYSELKKAKKGTEDYRSAKEAIINQYGSYLEKLNAEQGRVLDVADAYNALKDSVIRAAKARAMQGFIDEELKKSGEKRAESTAMLTIWMTDAQIRQYENLVKGGKSTLKFLHQFPEDARRYIMNFGEVIRNEGNVIKNAERTFGMSLSEAINEKGGTSRKGTGGSVKNKAYWEDQKKALQGELENLEDNAKNKKRRNELQKQIHDIDQKHLSFYKEGKSGGRGGRSAARTTAQQVKKERLEQEKALYAHQQQLQRQEDEAARKRRDEALKREQEDAEREQEGIAKQLKLIELRKKAKINALSDETNSIVEQLRDNAQREWEIRNPKAVEGGKHFDRKSVTYDNLSQEVKEGLNAQFRQAEEQAAEEQRKIYDNLLEETRNFEQKRVDIKAHFAEKRKVLEQLEQEGTADKGNLDVLARQEEEALKAVTDQELQYAEKTIPIFTSLFADAAQKSRKEINDLIEKTQNFLDALAEPNGKARALDFGMSQTAFEQLQKSPEKIQAIKQQLDKLYQYSNGSKDPFSKLLETIEKVKKEGSKLDLSQKMQHIAAAAAPAIGAIKGITDGIAAAAKAAGNDELASQAEAVGGVLQGVGNIAQGFAQGGIVGGALAAVGEGLKVVTSAFEAAARHKQALLEIQKEINNQQELYNELLRKEQLEGRDMESVFGTSKLGKGKAALQVASELNAEIKQQIRGNFEELKKYRVQLASQGKLDAFFDEETRVTTANGTKYGDNAKRLRELFVNNREAEIAGLAKLSVKTGHVKTGVFGWGAGRDTYSALTSQYKDLVKANGHLNLELAKSIVQTRQFEGDGKNAFEALIKKEEQYEESLKKMDEYLSGIFGNYGDDVLNAVVDAFNKGEDAAKAFGDATNKVMQQMVKDMMQAAVLQPILKEQAEKMKRAFESGDNNTMLKAAAQATKVIQGAQGRLKEMYAQLSGELKKEGIDLATDTTTRQASEKGIATASQDSVNELNGRMTAIQGHTFSIAEQTRMLANNSSLILRSVMGIERNTNDLPTRLAAVESATKAMKNSLDDIAIKGVKIKN